jgi:hypothetical protein
MLFFPLPHRCLFLQWYRKVGFSEVMMDDKKGACGTQSCNRGVEYPRVHSPWSGLEVEDWYVRSGGRRHRLSMIRSRWEPGA